MIDDIEAFRTAWNAASAIEAAPRPSQPIQKALDLLAESIVSRVSHGSTVQAALKPFLTAVRKENASTSDPSSLDVAVFRDGDRWLVDTRMGFASSVSAFSRNGTRLSLPAELRWSYRYFGSFLKAGPLLAFDGLSLSDAGVRYDYRLRWLRRTPQGYVSAGLATGTWTFGEDTQAHLSAQGNRVTLRRLDAPKSFFFANVERALRTTETWKIDATTARKTKTVLGDADLRAADQWLQTHRGTKLGNGWTVGTDNGMVSSIRRGKDFVELELEEVRLHFSLVSRAGKLVVRDVTIRK